MTRSMTRSARILAPLAALALIGACTTPPAGTSGATGGAGTPTTAATGGSPTTGATGTAGATGEDVSGDVEVFSWWTGGGEAAGLEAMLAVFEQQYPDATFVNAAVAGGAGTNARAVLATRLQAADPPDSFQGHAGQELIGTYVAADQLEPLNDLYDANGWRDVMPESLIPLISQGDSIYSVPVNIHRANVLWYNPKVLSEHGIQPPTTWEEFFTAAETLKAAGVIPLAMGEQWTAMHLFETVLLGTVGPEKNNALWASGGDWASPDVATALDNFRRAVEYTNEDAASLTWQDAAKLVADGDAGFNIMGDWVDGYFSGTTEGGNLALTPGQDYNWAPVPGTDGTFQFLSDSFTLPRGAPNAAGARAWLTVSGSREGQEAFNPVKGSICARTDCNTELFNEYLKSAIDDWSQDGIVGSLTHGVVAADPLKAAMDTALGLFLQSRDSAALQAALQAAFGAEGPQ